MGKDIVREALTNVTKWGIEYRTGQARSLVQRALGRPVAPTPDAERQR